MNPKALVFILFAAWSAICWRWYVCGIKESCGDERAKPAIVETSPAIEPESKPAPTTSEQATQPAENKPPTVEKSTGATDIGRVQLEAVEDGVVIHFPYQSTRREDNAAIDDYLSRLAEYLKNSGAAVTITGHTDFVGETKNNYSMGLRRAQGVRDILVKKGVSKSQIKCKSFGESKPVATNDTALGRYKNRRVEIRVSK